MNIKNFKLCGVGIATALILSACGSDSSSHKKEAVTSASISFDPLNYQISVPNDLFYLNTTDGTLNIPSTDPENPANPLNGLNALDGWSPNNAIELGVDLHNGVTIDEQSLQTSDSIRLFEVVKGGNANYSECSNVPSTLNCRAINELQYGSDFITALNNNNIKIILLKPLKNATTYLGAVTSQLKDSKGANVGGSLAYTEFKQDITTNPLNTEEKQSLQMLINNDERILASMGIDKADISYSWSMTTQSVGSVLTSVKGMLVSGAIEQPSATAINSNCSAYDVMTGNEDLGCNLWDTAILDPSDENAQLFKSAKFYTGSVKIPFFSDPNAPMTGHWEARCDSAVTLKGYVDAGNTLPTDAVSENDAVCMSLSNGMLRDLGIDKARNLTKYNSIPKLKGRENGYEHIDLQMTIPDLDVVNALRPKFGLSNDLTIPANGFPVVIIQHGITVSKEYMTSLTGMLSLYGIATVAIDHPLHGSRGYDLDGDGVDDINATTNSVGDYANLTSLLTTRDNLRESVADLLSLRIALHNLTDENGDKLKINPFEVSFIGHSLGAITGTNFTTLANATTGNAALDNLFKIDATVLASAGGSIANFLLESPDYGMAIQAIATFTISENFQKYYLENGNANLGEPDFNLETLVYEYALWRSNVATDKELNTLKSLVSAFLGTGQTIVDAGDPINYANLNVANNSPVLAFEMVGDGSAINLSDRVIPNETTSQIGGTEPLLNALNLAPITASVNSANITRGAVRFLYGHHSSVIDPRPQEKNSLDNTLETTLEMQTQIASFILSKGTSVQVNNTNLIRQD